MKKFGLFCRLLFLAVFLPSQVIFAYDQGRISDADEELVTGIVNIPAEVVDSTILGFGLDDEVVICHADEAWNYGFIAIPSNVLDSSSFLPNLPIEAVICHADEVWGGQLVKEDIFSTLPSSASVKNPVLFVPGLLGTEINDLDNSVIWLDADRIVNPLRLESYFDNFLDQLSFNQYLSASNQGLILGEVIKFKQFLRIRKDYTQLLVDEFASKGYVENQDFFTFPYDWRYGVSGIYPERDGVCEVRTNMTLLKEKINQILAQTGADKVDVIAHSLGGLVVKKYIIENNDPKIDKLVYLGVPNLGSPVAAKTLLRGHDFNIAGLNSDEMKKISQNMPVVYDLLPSKTYFTKRDTYLQIRPYSYDGGKTQNLNYEETMVHLSAFGTNYKAVVKADILHSLEFDLFDTRTKGIETYNIVGCKLGTYHGLLDAQDEDRLTYGNYIDDEQFISGDDTVPFESADSIPADGNKQFYAPLAKHGQMPSADGIRQKIVSIVASVVYPEFSNVVTHEYFVANHELCEITGDNIIVKSPVDIFVTEIDSGKNLRLGLDEYGNIIQEIPGASFDVVDGHKYLFLPNGDGQVYSISLRGTGSGTFTLVDKKIEGDEAKSAQIFNDIPVTPDFSGNLEIDSNGARIITSGGEVLEPTSEVAGSAAKDIIPPLTSVKINGLVADQDFYQGNATMELLAQDSAQGGVIPAGVYSLSYRLDDNATSTVQGATTTIAVAGEGRHTLTFLAGDKLGNKEEPKTISFNIDTTPPAIVVTQPVEMETYILNQPVAANYECGDNGSGLASCAGSVANGENIDTASVGTHTFSINAADNVGNAITKIVTYKVIYRFYGFLQPINDTAHQICSGCAASIFKGGSTVPVKFQIKDYNGVAVQAGSAPLWIAPVKGNLTSSQIDESVYTDPITSGSNFRYDVDSKQYIFNWGTKGFAPGYFWRIGAKLDDGSAQTVSVGLK